MRVLFVTHTQKMGGANHSMVRMISELKTNYNIGIVVIVPIRKGSRDVEKQLKALNVKFIRQRYSWFKMYKSNYRIKAAINYLVDRCFYRYNINKIKELDFDIVHSNSSVIDYGLYIAKMFNIKHIWHLREYGDLDFDLVPIFGIKNEIRKYQSCENYFVAISNSVANHFKEKIAGRPILTIYNGVAIPTPSLIAKHKNENVLFCCLANLSFAKNQMDIFKAINCLVNIKKVRNFHVFFYGREDNGYKEELTSYSLQHNINDYISLKGEISNVHEVLSQMDVGLISSRCEAFGRITVEYMMQELAVIASSSGANQEIIDDKKTGLIYKTGDEEDLAKKMQFLIENKDDMLKIAKDGRKKAEKFFSSENNSRNISVHYKDVLNL